jgi:hypothetical protein
MLSLLLLLPSPVIAQSGNGSPFSEGETLRYKVRWAFIRLGTVEIQQCPTAPGDLKNHQFLLSVKSAAGLPFINLDFSQMTMATIDPLEIHQVDIVDSSAGNAKTVYQVQDEMQQIIAIDSCDGEEVKRDSISIADQCFEALSLLMVARLNARRTTSILLPTIVDGKIGETILDFTGETQEIEVPALEESVEAFHFTGDARWVGSSFGGMKGKFEGWISCDDAAVPLRAEVAIFLGSIVLELESIQRPQLQPRDTASATALPRQ